MTVIDSRVPLISDSFHSPKTDLKVDLVEVTKGSEKNLPDLLIYTQRKVITTNENHVLISQFKDVYGNVVETYPSPQELKRYVNIAGIVSGD